MLFFSLSSLSQASGIGDLERMSAEGLPDAGSFSVPSAGMIPAEIPGLFGKIVGGQTAEKGEFPSIVSLQSGWFGHFCGGTLVKKNWVLTAAHCLGGSIRSVYVGLHNVKETSEGERFSVIETVRHPKLNAEIMDYDFALLKLGGKSSYEPARLNRQPVEQGAVFTVAGWGKTSESGGSLPSLLQKVEVPFVDEAACGEAYPGNITNSMICAGFPEGGKDSCQGDSGGPLFMNDGQGPVLAGVVSWGEGCARPGKYGVYGKVSEIADWVEEVTAE